MAQVRHIVSPTAIQALATAMLNAEPALAYENVGPSSNADVGTSRKPFNSRNRRKGRKPRNRPTDEVEPTVHSINSMTMIQMNVEKPLDPQEKVILKAR